MKLKIFLTPLILLSAFLLTSCGGSSNTSNDNSDSDNTITSINVDTANTNLDLTSGKYQVVGTSTSTLATSNTIDIENNEGDIVSLMDGNVMILTGRKYKGDDIVNISVESSAIMMVLLQPQFMGTESTDPKELDSRIRAHPNFQDITSAIIKDINEDSPCPLDPMCNSEANTFSQKIAQDIQIDDLL